MDPLLNAWANVTWLVFNWFSAWWRDVDGSITFLQRIGQ